MDSPVTRSATDPAAVSIRTFALSGSATTARHTSSPCPRQVPVEDDDVVAVHRRPGQRRVAVVTAGTDPGSGSGPDDDASAFTECMRAHGLADFPDATVVHGLLVLDLDGAAISPFAADYRSALAACSADLPDDVVLPTEPTPPAAPPSPENGELPPTPPPTPEAPPLPG
jgi:hypothetical protein